MYRGWYSVLKNSPDRPTCALVINKCACTEITKKFKQILVRTIILKIQTFPPCVMLKFHFGIPCN